MRQFLLSTVLIISLMLAFACSQQGKDAAGRLSTATVYSSIEEALATVEGSDKPVIVDFYTDW